MKSSKATVDLIVQEEVSSPALYDKLYAHFCWPGDASGATIGCGYDLGYASKDEIRADWAGIVSNATLAQLMIAQGKKATTASVFVNNNKYSVTIPWEVAQRQFVERELPKWEAKLIASLPNTDLLSPDSFGALVSLIYNRGASFNLLGARYQEMRTIKACMANQMFDEIPAQIRAMKRLWSNGLAVRREREAQLFERGLKAKAGLTPVALVSHQETVVRQAATVGAITGAAVGGATFLVAPSSPHALWLVPLTLSISAILTIGISLYRHRQQRFARADP